MEGNRSPSVAALILLSLVSIEALVPFGCGRLVSLASPCRGYGCIHDTPQTRRNSGRRTSIPLVLAMGAEGNTDPGSGGLHTRLPDDGGEEELLDVGGDPFFLTDDKDDVLVDDPAHSIGDDPFLSGEEEKVEWDGEVIESAHDDDSETYFADEDAPMPSMSFMASMASMPGTLDVVANTSDESPSQPSIAGTSFNPDLGAGGLHTRLSDDFGEEDVLEMGGDPFFLSNDECEDDVLVDDPAHSIGDDPFDPPKNEEEEWEWDGEVIEDAHFDFY